MSRAGPSACPQTPRPLWQAVVALPLAALVVALLGHHKIAMRADGDGVRVGFAAAALFALVSALVRD